jgi:hypothetical protein
LPHICIHVRGQKRFPKDTQFFAGVRFQTLRRKNEYHLPSAEIKERFLFFQARHLPIKKIPIQIDGFDDGFWQTGRTKPNSVHPIQGHDLARKKVLLALPTTALFFVLPRTIRAARTLTLLAPDR